MDKEKVKFLVLGLTKMCGRYYATTILYRIVSWVELTRRQHSFRMNKSGHMLGRLDHFDEIAISMEMVSYVVDEVHQMTIWLGIIPSEYEMSVAFSIIP